jgi:ATP adenylyltransferase
MEKLWSPWRSNYIQSFKEEKKEGNCIFCAAIAEQIESDSCLKVFESYYSFVMLNLYPYNSGHIMVIPNRHVSSMLELKEDELNEMMKLVGFSIRALEAAIKPQGFNFGANFGKAAGAGIDDHIHFHVVPRWIGDTNFMPALGEVKVISEDLLSTKNLLRNAFKELTQS